MPVQVNTRVSCTSEIERIAHLLRALARALSYASHRSSAVARQANLTVERKIAQEVRVMSAGWAAFEGTSCARRSPRSGSARDSGQRREISASTRRQ
jgi:hypothetical protein